MGNHAKRRPYRRWTDEEKEDLLVMYGSKPLKQLERYFDRSENAIKIKHYELTGTKDVFLATGALSTQEVGAALGVSSATVINWIKYYGLPCFQQNKGLGAKTRWRYSIEPEVFWKWASKNRDKVPFCRLKRQAILPEPDWLETQIESSFLKREGKGNKNWTNKEDEEAWGMKQMGLGYRQIAKHLNRPEKGTQKRLTVIKKRKKQVELNAAEH